MMSTDLLLGCLHTPGERRLQVAEPQEGRLGTAGHKLQVMKQHLFATGSVTTLHA